MSNSVPELVGPRLCPAGAQGFGDFAQYDSADRYRYYRSGLGPVPVPA